MTNKLIFIFLPLFTIVSCKEKTQKLEKVTIAVPKPTQTENPSPEKVEPPSSAWDFMNVAVEKFPVSEATSFDTYDASYRENHPAARVYRKLKRAQIEKLGLQDWLKNGTNVSVNYELPYSENFRTFVFTYQDGEMELKTVMVTFDQNFKKIDALQIAYDEIAESWMRTKSVISKNTIEVSDYNESSGETEITTTRYSITQTGKLVSVSKK